nr:RNA-directed DNA polymerase, eukaryota, reverse transcriptase zinc-binding domain protein [Tanacetum cinerariifolium]
MTFENSDEGGESTQELQNLIKELGYRNAMDVEDVLTHPEENVRELQEPQEELAIRVVQQVQHEYYAQGVKDVFKDHFETRFKQPAHGRLKLKISFPNRLSTDQVADMDCSVSQDKNCIAVWNCGENKSPSLDGSFPKGSNSSFIALILKVTDAKFVIDFRPISLIGCVYKVVTKILANRLATVISDLVSDIQSAFVANRQILNGSFILNEMLAWYKRKMKQAVIFKVNFAKAYDSVRWDYLLDVLQAFGFGPNWCKWTRGTFCSAMAFGLDPSPNLISL